MKKDLIKSMLKEEIESVDIKVSNKVLETPIDKVNISSNFENIKQPPKSFKFRLKPLLMSLCMVFVVLVIVVSLIAKTTNAASVLTSYIIDINPSVCIVTDDSDVVVNAYSLNNDGDELLADFDVNGKKLDDVLKLIVDSSIEKGFISFDKPPKIDLSITNDHEKHSISRGKYAREIFENELKNKGFNDFDITYKPLPVFDFKQRMGFDGDSNHLDDFKNDIQRRHKFFDPNFIPSSIQTF